MLAYKPKLINQLKRLNSKLAIELGEDMLAAVEPDQLNPGE